MGALVALFLLRLLVKCSCTSEDAPKLCEDQSLMQIKSKSVAAPDLPCGFDFFGSGQNSRYVNINASNLVYHEADVYVADIGDERILALRKKEDNADGTAACFEQSFLKKGDPIAMYSFESSMLSGVFDSYPGKHHHKQQQRIAVIGAGGGNIPRWLQHKVPAAQLDIVDLNPHVLSALKHFEVHEMPKVHFLLADGRKHLESVPDGSYHIIFIDVATNDFDYVVPPCFSTFEFWKMVRSKLAPGGRVAFNTVDPVSSKSFLLSAVAEAFPEQTLLVSAHEGFSDCAIVAEAPGGGDPREPPSPSWSTFRSGDSWQGARVEASKHDSTECPS